MQSETRTKKDVVTEILVADIDLPTSVIVYKCERKYGISVSARSVQRIRKEMKEMPNEDVFDTASEEMDKSHLTDDQVNLINLVNEGGWSIQQLAENTVYTVDQVREMVTGSLKEYITTSDVLDEDNESVYLEKDSATQEILDSLDKIDCGGAGGAPSEAGITVGSASGDSFWEVEQENVSTCGKVEKSVDVFMNTMSRRKAMFYMKWAGAREWLAYLVGMKKDGAYYITDLFLPNQCTSSTLVNKVEADNYNQLSIVGVIHSHHEMGAGDEDRPSFSGHDTAFINSNHNLSLLAGRDRETGGFKIVGIARAVTPCGAFVKIKANVKGYTDDPLEKEWKDEFLSKTMSQPINQGYAGKSYTPLTPGTAKTHETITPVVVNDKRTYQPDETGIVRTRGNGYHFNR